MSSSDDNLPRASERRQSLRWLAVILPQDRDLSGETNVRSLSPCAIKAVVLSPPSGCLWQLLTLLPKGNSDMAHAYIAPSRNLGESDG